MLVCATAARSSCCDCRPVGPSSSNVYVHKPCIIQANSSRIASRVRIAKTIRAATSNCLGAGVEKTIRTFNSVLKRIASYLPGWLEASCCFDPVVQKKGHDDTKIVLHVLISSKVDLCGYGQWAFVFKKCANLHASAWGARVYLAARIRFVIRKLWASQKLAA